MLRLQILVTIMAFFEVVGISSIGPFMTLVGDIDKINTNQYLNYLYVQTGLQSSSEFLFLTGVLVLVVLLVASLISMFTTWRLAVFSFETGTELADRLYNHYLNKNWMFHSEHSSAFLIKQISTESTRVTAQVILPFMQMNAKIVLVLFISLGLLIFNPVYSLVGIVTFISTYFILFRVVKNVLNSNGKNISEQTKNRLNLMSEGFGGIKDIIVLNRANFFRSKFELSGKELSKSGAVNNALAYVPRYLMELLSFGVMIVLILYLLINDSGGLGEILPVLAIYGIAGFKLLPALQNIYASISEIKSNLPAFKSIHNDLVDSIDLDEKVQSTEIETVEFSETNKIILEDVNFKYPGKSSLALNNINMTINANQAIGIVGSSGSGKSTLVDLLLGIITPTDGRYKFGDTEVNDLNIKAIRKRIGFVSQNIFLTGGSITENIAFGLDSKDIDYERVKIVSEIAMLNDFVSKMPEGLDTIVGERGVKISGGQRQRIGIARALYHDADLLIFDEATSALDGVTEKYIMSAINSLYGEKTIIIIAHRLKTIQKCDVIYILENGSIHNSGTYEHLQESDEKFKEMVELS
ncbi:ABC transporter ATP-binding protein [Halobacteriovorax sp. RZ-3]|uniref:ABC transporter ATP-binding protein n=1 Tax=Halobacteriovorax sp. RZ-3 TaxID=3157720 RepID=UPI0037100F7D